MTLAAEGVTDAAGTGHGPVSGAGAGHPAAVVQRHPLTCQWQSQGTVGAKSRRRSFMEEQGLLWPRPRFPPLQRPLFRHGLNNSAEPKWRPPAHGSGSIGSHPRRPGGSRLGASVAVAVPANGTRAGASKGRRAGTNGPRRTKGRDWAKPDPKDKPPEGGEAFAAAPAAPGGDPYQVAEATKEEIEAAAAWQAEREEEGFHAQLWQEAAQQALADPDRPLCARELVKNGRLTAWWSMSWKDARTQIDGALVDEYRDLLRGYFVGPPDGPGMLPEPVLERCACIFAWFKQNNRPVFQVEGRAVEGSIFKVPGQMVVFFPTTIHGPSYKEPANHRNSLTISHGLPWTSALGVGQLGELAPGDFTEGEFPTYGFSGRGSCNEFSEGSIRSSITKVAARSKGKDVILTLEGRLEVNTPQVEGGMFHLNAACRDAGSARSGDHMLLHPRNAVLKGISVPWPV